MLIKDELDERSIIELEERLLLNAARLEERLVDEDSVVLGGKKLDKNIVDEEYVLPGPEDVTWLDDTADDAALTGIDDELWPRLDEELSTLELN